MLKKITSLAVLFLAAGIYISAVLVSVHSHLDASEMDTTAYLSAAYQIRQTGGIARHLQNSFSGVYREATQHPLYLLLLSPWAERDLRFFVRAKIITFLVGLALLFVFFFSVRTVLGVPAALVGSCLLTLNATYFHLSTMVACESLLAFFFLLFWLFAVKGFQNNRWWLLSGFFAGLSFLTKSLGIFILPVFFISVFLCTREKIKGFGNRYFWGFFAVFFLVASPLLVRNIRVFGSPFYSDSSAVLWLDRWHDYDRADIKENPPTLKSYLETHTPGQIAAIFFQGMFVRIPKMVSDGLKPFPFWEHKIPTAKLRGFYQRTASWQDIWAVSLCLLCLAGLWKERKNPAAVIASLSLVVFFLFVGWYSKVFPGYPPTRLIYPVLFFILIFATKTLVDIFSRGLSLFLTKNASEIALRVLCGIFCLAYFVSILTHFDWKTLKIKNSYAFNYAVLGELQWIQQQVRPGQRIMAGTMLTSYLFYFEPTLKAKIILWPKVKNLDELKKYVRQQSLEYGVLDLATVAYNMDTYGKFFQVGPTIGLHPVEDLPPPFHKVYRDPSALALYEIYAFDQTL